MPNHKLLLHTIPPDEPADQPSGLSQPSERMLRQNHARHRITERRRVIQKLRQALATDGLALHFQPILSLSSGLARGAEAQLRLRHSRRGLIPIGHFLPMVEQSDVIIDVGGWMLRAACTQAVALPGNFSIALALSQRHLQSGKLVKQLLEALNAVNLNPDRLELLITEAMLLDENEDTIFALKAVRGLGVRLALDHFGAGYASLTPLKRLPFSTLRLDRSLTQSLSEGGTFTAITHAAVEAGHALGCIVLADGVESAVQYELLRQVKVDEAQGSFFGAPISGPELRAMFGAV